MEGLGPSKQTLAQVQQILCAAQTELTHGSASAISQNINCTLHEYSKDPNSHSMGRNTKELWKSCKPVLLTPALENPKGQTSRFLTSANASRPKSALNSSLLSITGFREYCSSENLYGGIHSSDLVNRKELCFGGYKAEYLISVLLFSPSPTETTNRK